MLSYLDPRPEDAADAVFPTEASSRLFSMVHGVRGACRGQTIHQTLRDPSIFRKQLLYSLSRFVLNGASLRHVSSLWRHQQEIFLPPGEEYDDSEEYREYFDTWSAAVRQSTTETVSVAVERLIYRHAADDRYCRYVDWISTVGIVPVVDRSFDARASRDAIDTTENMFVRAFEACPVLDVTDPHVLPTVRKCLAALILTDVPNSPEIRIHRVRKDGRLEGFDGPRRIRLHVHAEPLTVETGTIIYTTPVAHVRYEILRHAELCRHRKICQLLNTFPVKAITSSRHELNTKRIVELMEKRDKAVDAKTSIIKFLLNVSDSKSKVGLEDSVESFLQDLTPSVDQSRLLPTRSAASGYSSEPPTQDVRELFRRQVIRCLEEQIQDHVDEIQNLKTLNRTWENKARELKETLDRYASEFRGLGDPSDIETAATLDAVNQVNALPFHTLPIEDNRLVANSFFSQFVPETTGSDGRLSALWEDEYFRSFKFRKNVTNQGQEESLSYSNYTIERVLLPFVTSVLGVPLLDPIPEEYLSLSFREIVDVVYEDSRLNRHIGFLRSRELVRRRRALADGVLRRRSPHPAKYRPGSDDEETERDRTGARALVRLGPQKLFRRHRHGRGPDGQRSHGDS